MALFYWVAGVLVAYATLQTPAAAGEANEPIESLSPAQSAPAGEPGRPATPPADSHSAAAAGKALRIDLGPLPVEEKDPRPAGGERTGNGHRIGVHRALPGVFTGNLAAYLEWVADASGQHTAAITFRSEHAVSIRIAVRADVPPGASVQIFDGAGQPHGRAYTRADFNSDPPAPVWLPSAEGHTLTVQITLPSAATIEALSIAVTSVAHRFAALVPQADPDCPGHLDVACTTSQRVRDTMRSVARIRYEKTGGSYVCSGTLLTTRRVNDDDRLPPYFLTAHHCVPSAAVAGTVEAWWFWKHARCRSTQRDPRFVVSYGGADLLATSPAQDASLLRFKAALPYGRRYAGWSTRDVPLNGYVFAVHHPGGAEARYATGRVQEIWTGYVGENLLRDALAVDWTRGLTEPGSSGSGLFRGDYLAGVLSGSPVDQCDTDSIYGSFRDFFPHIRQWLDPSNYQPTHMHYLPLLTPASNAAQVGVVRIISRSDRDGDVSIHAIDDTGERYGPAVFELGTRQTEQFNASQLEAVIGVGEGNWRVELSTTLDIKALAFIRFYDGYLTPVHDVVPEDLEQGHYHVKKFFPAKHKHHSFLRLINPTGALLDVTVVAVTDNGAPVAGAIHLTLPAGAARRLSAMQIEQGDDDFEGLGDAEEGWQLFITADKPLWVMNLMQDPSGRLANLSTSAPALE